MNLEIKKFDITLLIKKDKVCVFAGKRETGKSFLIEIYYTIIKIYLLVL